MEQSLPTETQTCATCNTTLQGKFCHQCGEKKLHPAHDFSVLHFLEETFESFTHLDSRVLRSCKAIFLQPGFLSAEFLAGRRVRYLKPIPLFIIAGVLFYLFFGTATAFFSNLGDMNNGYENNNRVSNTFHVNTGAIFSEKASALKREPEALWQEMSKEASHRSKTWLFLIAPAWALFFWALFRKKYPGLVPHLIFALHGLTFFILFDLLMLTFIAKVLGVRSLGDSYSFFLAICFAIYNTMAIRRVYGISRFYSIAAGILAMIVFLIILILYRQFMTVWTLTTF